MTNREFLAKQLALEDRGEGYVLVTVAEADGSAPRNEGRMLVLENGKTYGTIGGGAIELVAARDAFDCLEGGENRLQAYDLASLGMTCGGKMSLMYQCFAPGSVLLICGGGHVSAKLSAMAHIMGYHVIVADDRSESAIAEALSNADRFIPVSDYYADIKTVKLPANAYIVIATYGHEHDGEALAAALEKNAAYVGMIGSVKKIGTIFDALMQKGYTQEQLKDVYSPIGLGLGGQTPEDIALSILAEMQIIRCGGSGAHMRDKKRR
ncbi:MAG: XdhC family protein [Oscillospiraceae bacterium]